VVDAQGKCGVSLRGVGVYEQGPMAQAGDRRGKVDGGRGLSGAALLTDNSENA
jgi:hypothetical protein